MANKAAERIKYKTEVLKLLVLLIVAVGGGSVGLVLGKLTFLRATIATTGVALALVLLVVTWRQHRRIEMLIEHLQENL